jgi:ankyrin repeat protein
VEKKMPVLIGPSDIANPHYELLVCSETGQIDRIHALLSSRLLPLQEKNKDDDNDDNDNDEDEDNEPVILDIECCYRVSGLTPLASAVLEDQYEAVNVLLRYGANPNTIDKEGMTPLLISTDLQITETLLKHGAYVDARDPETGATSFLLAYLRGDTSLWRLLVHYKANVNVADKNGQHALNTAIDKGDFESAAFLLDHGANSRLCDSEGCPSLVTACRMARIDLVRLLLANGADIERSEASQADTPLIVAARGNQLEMVRELCNHGCKILKHNKHGDTAIHCARTLGFDDVALVLESFARLRREIMPAGLQPILSPSGSPRFKQEPPLPPSRHKVPTMKLARAVERNHAAIESLGAKMKKIMDEERKQKEIEEEAIAAANEVKRLVIETEKLERIEKFKKEKARQEQEEEEEEKVKELQKLMILSTATENENDTKDAYTALRMTSQYTTSIVDREANGNTFQSIIDAKRYLEDLRGRAVITDNQLQPLSTPALREWFMPDHLATGPRFIALDTRSISPLTDECYSLASRAPSPSRSAKLVVEPRDFSKTRRFVEINGKGRGRGKGKGKEDTFTNPTQPRIRKTLREMEHANLKKNQKLAKKKLADALQARHEHISPRFSSSISLVEQEQQTRVFDLGASLITRGQNSIATLTDLNVHPGLSFLSNEKKRESEMNGKGSSLAAALQFARDHLPSSSHHLLTSPMKMKRYL